jgi:hypothetical protein
MLLDQLKPNIIVRGPIFPEPVQVIVAIPMGTSVKLIGKGLNTNQVHEPIPEDERDEYIEEIENAAISFDPTLLKEEILQIGRLIDAIVKLRARLRGESSCAALID